MESKEYSFELRCNMIDSIKVGDTVQIEGMTGFCSGGESLVTAINDSMIYCGELAFGRKSGEAITPPYAYFIAYIVRRAENTDHPNKSPYRHLFLPISVVKDWAYDVCRYNFNKIGSEDERKEFTPSCITSLKIEGDELIVNIDLSQK